MAQILSMGRCTNLNLSSRGRSLLLYLERAGIDANTRTQPPEKAPVRSTFLLPILFASELQGQGWPYLLKSNYISTGSFYPKRSFKLLKKPGGEGRELATYSQSVLLSAIVTAADRYLSVKVGHAPADYE